MLHDLERGNRLELDWLAGYVVKLGRELGMATPAKESVCRVLKLHRFGAGASTTAAAQELSPPTFATCEGCEVAESGLVSLNRSGTLRVRERTRCRGMALRAGLARAAEAELTI